MRLIYKLKGCSTGAKHAHPNEYLICAGWYFYLPSTGASPNLRGKSERGGAKWDRRVYGLICDFSQNESYLVQNTYRFNNIY